MHVLFVEPAFPANQREFVRGLHAVGARVTGIGERPYEHLDGQLKGWLSGYEQVRSVCDVPALEAAVRKIQAAGPWVDRLEATVESHMLPAAQVRARTGIPGLSVETVTLCRDKFVMKRFLRRKGVPCARNAAVSTGAEARAFAAEVGYPLILKPRDGAGAHGTHRLDSDADLERAVAAEGLDQAPAGYTMEEFVSGHEGFFDTITAGGQTVFEGICHYYPNVLEAMRTRWISPQIVVTNRIDAPGYDEVKQMGRRVIQAMGVDGSATHMEWFFGERGLSFSEIGARPPGCTLWDLYCKANDMDLYAEWARAICGAPSRQRPSRRFAAGLVSIRPDRDGVVRGYSGVDEIRARHGDWIFKLHLPPPGSRTNEVGGGYLAHAYVFVHHPDYDRCRAILDDIGRTMKMWAG